MTDVRDQIEQWVQRDEERIVELFSGLVKCPTPSPPGDTRAAMGLVEQFLTERQLPAQFVTADPSMPNVLSSVAMPAVGPHLMFSGHLDVLPAGAEPGWMDDPWSGKVQGGRVFGRGASDMKAGVTAMLFAYSYVTQLAGGLGGRLSIALVSDEETGMGRGTGYMFEQIGPQMVADCVLTAEPGGTEAITFASKGYLSFTVTVTTRGAIAGYPNASNSAVHIAADIIRDLRALEDIPIEIPSALADLLADPDYREALDDLYGEGSAELIPSTSVNVGVIHGGSSAAVIASHCTFDVAVVMPVGADPYTVFNEARHIVAAHPGAQIVLEGLDTADYTTPDHEMVRLLQDTVTSLGKPRPMAVPDVAISDLRYWRYQGTPGFWYGPDGADVSAANESVAIDEVLHLVRTYALTASQYLTPLRRSPHDHDTTQVPR